MGWSLNPKKRTASKQVMLRQPRHPASEAKLEPKPWYLDFAKLLLGLSIPAAAATVLALYALLGDILDDRNLISIRVQSMPLFISDGGFSSSSLEARIQIELKRALRDLTIPGLTPGAQKLAASLQRLAPDTKVEIRGTEVSLKPISGYLRRSLGKEDTEISIYMHGPLQQTVVTIQAQVGDRTLQEDMLYDYAGRSLANLPADITRAIFRAALPLAEAASLAREIPACFPQCEGLVTEVLHWVRIAQIAPPLWDAELAKLLRVQFELVRGTARGPASPELRSTMADQLNTISSDKQRDYRVLFSSAWLFAALGFESRAHQVITQAILAVASSKKSNGQSVALCARTEKGTPPIEVSALAILCVSEVVLSQKTNIKTQLKAVHEIAKWSGKRADVLLFAALSSPRFGSTETEALMIEASFSSDSPVHPLAYAVVLEKRGAHEVALRYMDTAMRRMIAPDGIEDAMFSQTTRLATILKERSLAKLAGKCASLPAFDRVYCRQAFRDSLSEAISRRASRSPQ